MEGSVEGYMGELKRPVSFTTPGDVEGETLEAMLWQGGEAIEVTTPQITTAEAEGAETVMNIDLSHEDIAPGTGYLVISVAETQRVLSKSVMIIYARDGFSV